MGTFLDGPQKVDVDQADALPEETVLLDEGESLVVRRVPRVGQRREQFEDLVPLPERPTGEFTDDERMAYALSEPDESFRVGSTAISKLPVVEAIAAELGIATSTVRSHLDRIGQKTGARRRPAIRRLARRLGLPTSDDAT